MPVRNGRPSGEPALARTCGGLVAPPELTPGVGRHKPLSEACPADLKWVALGNGEIVDGRDSRDRLTVGGRSCAFGLVPNRGVPRAFDEVVGYFGLTRETVRELEACAVSELRHANKP